MRRVAFACAGVLICVGLLFQQSGHCAEVEKESREGRVKRGPVFEVDEDTADFGTVHEGDVKHVTHTFRFRNAGTRDLVLREVKPTCGCTDAIPSATTLAPGDEGTIVAVLDTAERYGDQSVNVQLKTNERKKNREHVLTLKGLILRSWGMVPEVLDLREIVAGETKEVFPSVYTQFFEGMDLQKITGARSNTESVEAATAGYSLPTEPKEGKTYLELKRPIRVRVTASEELGPATAEVVLSTDDPKKPTIAFTVRWRVTGDLASSLKQVFLTKMRGNSRPRSFYMFSRSSLPFEIVSAKVENKEGDPVAVEIVAAEKNSPSRKNFEFKVPDALEGEKKAKTYKGKVVFETTHPDQKTLALPYMVTVRN